MPSTCTQSSPYIAAEKQVHQKFGSRDPEIEMMLRGLLHELRNPLSSILTAATLLHDSPAPDTAEGDEESRMLLEVVKKESLRLNHILTEFAGYVKLPFPQPHAFDLTNAARASIARAQQEGVLPPGVAVVDELPEPCLVWADESQIRMALGHILKNAGEAMLSGGELRLSIEASETPQNVVLCIADSGQGFTSESRDRAFQPFYSDKNQSLGLGLSATRSLVEASQGRVWLDGARVEDDSDSTPARSDLPTRICLELPCDKP